MIRQELSADYVIVESVVKQAFTGAEHTDGNEHNLVGKLRKSGAFVPELSLVAEIDGEIAGHILLTKIKVGDREALALAPVSVLPTFQNKGIGKGLIFAAIEKAKELGFKMIVVLGHPDYYPKFGFKKAVDFGITAPFSDVEDYLFVLAFEKPWSGKIEYSKEFF